MAKVNLPLFLDLFVLRFQQPGRVHLKFPKRIEGRQGFVSVFNPVLNDKDFVVEILKTVRGEGGLQNLFDADIIISGGRGATGDNLGLIKALAEALKTEGINAEWPVADR